MVSNSTDTMWFSCGVLKVKVFENKREETAGLSMTMRFPVQCSACQSGEKYKTNAGKRVCCAVLLCCVAWRLEKCLKQLREAKKHEIIVEGQRLQKANIMEGDAFFPGNEQKNMWSLLAILTCKSFFTFRSACFTQGSWNWTALSGKANDWKNRQQDNGRWKRREKERKRERVRGERERERERENGGKREEREGLSVCAFKNACVCAFRTSPCVPATCPHVFFISKISCSERPTSIIDFLKVLSRMNLSWMLSYFFLRHFFASWFAVK